MKMPGKAMWKRAGRLGAGAQVVFTLGTAPVPPRTDPPSREAELQSQWAQNDKTNVQTGHTRRAVELGQQLREPEQSEHRPPPPGSERQPSQRDTLDTSLAERSAPERSGGEHSTPEHSTPERSGGEHGRER